MRLVTFSHNAATHAGVEEDGRVFDLTDAWPADDARPYGAGDLLTRLPAVRQTLQRRRAEDRLWRTGLTLKAPLRPGKIVAIGLNYRDHARETNQALPKAPLIFAKFPTSVIGPGDAIRRPSFVTELDYEAELGVVIGRLARKVDEAEALQFVGAYTCLHDATARELQRGDGQWIRGKSLDTLCPIGPVLVTSDEIPDPGVLPIRCRVNGEVLQDSNTRELIFSVPQLIAYCSRMFTLEPGDVIATGTPAGVGFARKPPRFLQPGDVAEIEIEGIGRLVNPVVAEDG